MRPQMEEVNIGSPARILNSKVLLGVLCVWILGGLLSDKCLRGCMVWVPDSISPEDLHPWTNGRANDSRICAD